MVEKNKQYKKWRKFKNYCYDKRHLPWSVEVIPVLGPGFRLVPECKAGAGPFTAGGATLPCCSTAAPIGLFTCWITVLRTLSMLKKTKKQKSKMKAVKLNLDPQFIFLHWSGFRRQKRADSNRLIRKIYNKFKHKKIEWWK